jgi:hypothetical protein
MLLVYLRFIALMSQRHDGPAYLYLCVVEQQGKKS